MAACLLEIFVILGSICCIQSLNVTKQNCTECMGSWTKKEYHSCMMNASDVDPCKSVQSVGQGCDIMDEEDYKAFWNLLDTQNEVNRKIILQSFPVHEVQEMQ